MMELVERDKDQILEFGPNLTVCINAARPFELPLQVPISQVERIEFRRSEERSVRFDEMNGATQITIHLADRTASALHAFVTRDVPGHYRVWDCDSKNGTTVNGQPIVGQQHLKNGDLIRFGSTFVLFTDGAASKSELVPQRSFDSPAATLHAEFAVALASAQEASLAQIPILISGPTGSGSNQVARWLHNAAGRSGPFVRLPAFRLLDELELFRRANGGTLFLDGLERLRASDAAILASLLDADQWQHSTTNQGVPFAVIGSCKEVADLPEGLRSACATHTLVLPPLRGRRADLGFLIARELLAANAGLNITLSRRVVESLLNYSWPGNLNELRPTISQMVSQSDGCTIDASHLPSEISGGSRTGNR